MWPALRAVDEAEGGAGAAKRAREQQRRAGFWALAVLRPVGAQKDAENYTCRDGRTVR